MNWSRPIGGPVKLAAILLVVVGLFLACAGFETLVAIPLIVVFGWPWYLGRVVPQLQPDPGTVVTAVVCLAGVAVGGHFFMRWLYGATGPEPGSRRWRVKWTVQTVGLVLLMFVAGIAVTGLVHQTVWLATSPDRIVISGRSDLRNRVYVMNSSKQVITATHNFAGESPTKDEMPRATFDATGRPMHSWQTLILPDLEWNSIFKQIDLTKPWDHADNARGMAATVRVYHTHSPADPVDGRGVSHFAGNVQVVLSDKPLRLGDDRSFPRGTANTIFFGEAASNYRAWGDPLNVRDPRLGANRHPDGFGAINRKPVFAMADGSVLTFEPAELEQLVGKVPE